MDKILEQEPPRLVADLLNSGNSKMTRKDVEEQLIAQCEKDPIAKFRLLSYPKLIVGKAIAQGLEINLVDFLHQIEDVKILNETANTLYLVLPVCHLGCKVSPVVEQFSDSPDCPVCGMLRGQCKNSTSTAGEMNSDDKSVDNRPEISRKELDEKLISKAKNEPQFRQRLLDQGKPVIIDILKQWGLGIPDFLTNIQEFKVFEETPHLIYMVFPWSAKSDRTFHIDQAPHSAQVPRVTSSSAA